MLIIPILFYYGRSGAHWEWYRVEHQQGPGHQRSPHRRGARQRHDRRNLSGSAPTGDRHWLRHHHMGVSPHRFHLLLHRQTNRHPSRQRQTNQGLRNGPFPKRLSLHARLLLLYVVQLHSSTHHLLQNHLSADLRIAGVPQFLGRTMRGCFFDCGDIIYQDCQHWRGNTGLWYYQHYFLPHLSALGTTDNPAGSPHRPGWGPAVPVGLDADDGLLDPRLHGAEHHQKSQEGGVHPHRQRHLYHWHFGLHLHRHGGLRYFRL